MIINHNLPGMNANRQMGINAANAGKSMEKLSSGLRINRAGDDAAGLAISEKMRGQIRGLDQASANAQDGISMIQTAEGALGETHSILQRMRELAVQSSNDTNVAVDRSEIQKEMDELAKEVTRISNNTEFNTQKLINGAIDDSGIKSAKFHVGANSGQNIELSIGAMDAKTLGVSRDTVSSATGTSSVPANIASATFSADEFGAGIMDATTLSFDYTAKVDAVNAVAAQWNSGAVTGGTAGTMIFNGVTVTLTAAGTSAANVTAANAVTVGVAGTDSADTTANAIIAALQKYKDSGAPANSALDNFTFSGNGAGITVVGKTTDGITNNALAITGTSVVGVGAPTVAGVDGVAAKSATVAITSTSGHSQTVNVDGSATKLTISNGAFEGMTLNAATNIATDLDGAATVTVSAATDVAASAVFSGGAFSSEATTKAGIDVSTQANASDAITTIQNAIENVSAERSKLGAYQNRLEHTIANLGTSSENLTSAESRIRDVNMAKEMSTFSKNNILSQAAQAMLAQANQQPQQVLQLLR